MTSMINSNVFAVEEKTFLFGTLFPSKNPDGIIEKFKITNLWLNKHLLSLWILILPKIYI